MFYQNFLKLCAQVGKKPNRVTKEIGLSTATATDWKKGRIPRDITLQKLADYFGVTIDELLDDSSKVTINDNHGMIGDAHAPVTIINGGERKLDEQAATLLNLFDKLGVLDKAKLIVYAEELANKSGL